MDTMSVPTHLHNLNDKWDMYYHLPHDKNWNLDSYNTIHKGINNVAVSYTHLTLPTKRIV